MKEHALVRVSDTNEISDVARRKPFEITQDHDLALLVGQERQELLHPGADMLGHEPVVDLVGPRLGRRRPRSRRVETILHDARRRDGPRAARDRPPNALGSAGCGTTMSASDERPSNRSTPRTTANQTSCVTSSATARLPTVVSARRSRRGWYRPTSAANADSSPARRRSTNSTSSSTRRDATTIDVSTLPYAEPFALAPSFHLDSPEQSSRACRLLRDSPPRRDSVGPAKIGGPRIRSRLTRTPSPVRR